MRLQDLDQQTGSGSKTQLVEQISAGLRTGDYSRAQDLLRSGAANFPNDAELAKLEKQAHGGGKNDTEVTRLITESQDLFAQQRSGEAIQLLRRAHELDKSNTLARAILANALVEHAHSLSETDWWESGKLARQALELNPAHPTAKTIRNLIQEKKETSSLEEWVRQVQKLQSSGDLIGALSLIAEGLDVHDRDPKLLLLQDAIQRDQDTRKRQSRRGDLEDLRRMESEIDGAKDEAAKKALAERIQALAAKYWTDGAVLTVANHLLRRLGFAQQESASASAQGKGGPVIFHVPRQRAPEAPRVDSSQAAPKQGLERSVAAGAGAAPTTSVAPMVPPSAPAPSPVVASPVAASRVVASPAPPPIVAPSPIAASPVALPTVAASAARVSPIPTSTPPVGKASPGVEPSSKSSPSKIPFRSVPPRVVPKRKARRAQAETGTELSSAASVLAVEDSARARVATPAVRPKRPEKSNLTMLVVISVTAAVIILTAAIFFFERKNHAAAPDAKAPAAAPASFETSTAPAPTPAPTVSAPAESAPATPVPTSARSAPSLPVAADTNAGQVVANHQTLPAEAGRSAGTLVVVAGQDGAKVFLNGKLQRQLTQSGQLRLPNLEPKDYVVQVSKSGFQDSPPQTIRLGKNEEVRLVLNLQPQPRLASLIVQGGAPGTTVLVDGNSVGTVQTDGTLSVGSINPGDHVVELRKERFKARQLKRQFAVGGAVTLTAADAALEGIPGELKITFSPPDAKIAIVKGDLLKMVSSGAPLSLPPGTYTLTARSADRIMRSGTIELAPGQSKSVDLSLAPSGMSRWDDAGAWRREGDAYTRKGGDYVLYGAAPSSGTFIFSAMPTKGHLLQWVVNYTDSRNYVLFQIDDSMFYRAVIRNGQKTSEVKVADKGDKKSFRTIQVRVSPTEIVHQIKHGDSWTVVDLWTQNGTNLGQGKFGFYIPGSDQVAVESFAFYGDLSIR